MASDILIRNGLIIDGSGNERRRADVAIRNNRIVEIGEKIVGKATTEIDADGRIVSPGFIDAHTHMDAQLFWDPFATNSSWHGVTSIVMGNCGFTLAPVAPGQHEHVVKNLERAEDISRDAINAAIDFTWTSFPSYMSVVDALPKALNVASYVGHSAIRTAVMGARAYSDTASEDDIAAMVELVSESMRAGAIGFSTSRSLHETADDQPVASRLASWDEVSRLVHAVGAHGSGVFELANETATLGADAEDYLEKLYDLAVSSGVPTTFGLEPAQRGLRLLELAERTDRAGGTMFGQSHSRGINTIYSFKSQMPFDRVVEWSEFRARPLDQQLRELQDPDVKARLVYAAHYGSYGRALASEPKKPDYARLAVLDRPLPPYRTVAELAAERAMDPVAVMLELAIATHGDALFLEPLTSSTEPELLEVMRHPQAVMTFSDAGAHVGQIADASIHTHLLAYWVRERQEFTLEQAVRMITATPAARWGLNGRGVIQEGAAADINIFDPDVIGPGLPTVAHDLPTGAMRLTQRAQGIDCTIVNGVVALRRGEHTGAMPGQLLRGPFVSTSPL